jgi:type II secretory pathway predicted ATPase ExeA
VLLFKKGKREREASVDVIVKSGAPPSVLIRPLTAEKINPTDLLIIESLIVSKKTINATWSCVQINEGSFSAKFINNSSRKHKGKNNNMTWFSRLRQH